MDEARGFDIDKFRQWGLARLRSHTPCKEKRFNVCMSTAMDDVCRTCFIEDTEKGDSDAKVRKG